MEKSVVVKALDTINLTKHGMPKKETINSLLEHYKKLRKEKDVTNEEAKAQHLNVYEKRGITVASILDYLIDQQWVEVVKNEQLQLTLEGRLHIESIYTNNNSSEYLQFKEDVFQTAAKYKEPTLAEQQIMKLFWNQWSLEQIEEHYFKDRFYIEKGHESFQKATGMIIPEDSMVLHIRPTLFLDWEDYGEDVQLAIDGVDVPEFELNRPLPNNRYVIAKLKGVNGEKLNEFGFYTFIEKREVFPNQRTLTYRWQIGEDKIIIHHIHIQFQSEYGNLYSTLQRTTRNCNIPYRVVKTFTGFEDIMEYCEKYAGEIKVAFDSNSKTIAIHENITLSSLPISLHYI